LLTGLWDFKDILNSRQNRSKNKLVGENAVTRTITWKLLAPGYGSCSYSSALYMYFILQGYVLVPQFFEKSELKSVIAAICELVDQLADKLYDAGKIQGRLF